MRGPGRGARRLLPLLALLALTASGLPVQAPPAVPRPWLDPALPLEQRVSLLLGALTLDEAASLLYGVAPPGLGPVGHVPGVPRLGVPPLVLSDGPAVLRDSGRTPRRRPATALPAPLALAASFDRGLAGQVGVLLGEQARARGVHVLYGPGVNLARVPVGGRLFEHLGEDPYLAGELAVPYVRGVQSQRVAAQVKHLVLNEQEDGRHTLSSHADERTLHEVYLAPFEAAVRRGGAWSVMCANNPVNGVHACEHAGLLTGVLRDRWGFDGVVGSDHAATRSAARSLRAGLDQSFTGRDWGRHYRDLPARVRAGELPRPLLMASARRVLRLLVPVGLLDPAVPVPPVDVEGHAAVARTVAERGTVLLKNAGPLLPLQPAALSRVAVVGPYATTAHPGGGGSSRVLPTRTTTPVQGLAARLGPSVEVLGDDGTDLARAAAAAAEADVAVVVVGDVAREGGDRPSLSLPPGQDALVEAVAAANPRTVVVLQTGGPVTMPWLGAVPAVLQAWYPGQEGGAALARVALGDVDPAGRLPVTFPTALEQAPSTGVPRYPAGPDGYVYDEGLLVGHRGYAALGRTPLFPFGHGLSYGAAALSDLALAGLPDGGVRASFTVRATGDRPATVVPQLYLDHPAGAGEPPGALVGFTRTEVAPGTEVRLQVRVPAAALRNWDPDADRWTTPRGTYRLSVGTSSADRPLSASFSR